MEQILKKHYLKITIGGLITLGLFIGQTSWSVSNLVNRVKSNEILCTENDTEIHELQEKYNNASLVQAQILVKLENIQSDIVEIKQSLNSR